eukprot:TRINITY_DN3295_c0_g1_i1.p1 TRINITY_DN3295_c0_g1~~TRINITY_DN3295_c0_g1_i1.p1  ORF type:complete len:133 (+),score=28.30 TRINITY_DN3295_c0_g1_i1:17-415(+)
MSQIYNFREERDYPQGFAEGYQRSVMNWLQDRNFTVHSNGYTVAGTQNESNSNVVIKIAFITKGDANTRVGVHYSEKVREENKHNELLEPLFSYLEGISKSPSVLVSQTGPETTVDLKANSSTEAHWNPFKS